MSVRSASDGFTLIELLTVVSIVALLVVLSVPSFKTWTANQQTRSVAEVIQNALRLAQSTAVHQGRRTTLCFTNSSPSSSLVTADVASNTTNCTASGKNWFVQIDHLFDAGDAAQYVQGGTFGNISTNVVITTSLTTPISFNPLGRITGPNANSDNVTYQFTNPKGDFNSTTTRSLNVTVSSGGQIRMCDSSRSIASSPDGC